MKIAINTCCDGGFGLSVEAANIYAAAKGLKLYFFGSKNWNSEVIELTPSEAMMTGCPVSITLTLDPKSERLENTIDRTDLELIAIIEGMGSKANAKWGARIDIIDIPSNEPYKILSNDGIERVTFDGLPGLIVQSSRLW